MSNDRFEELVRVARQSRRTPLDRDPIKAIMAYMDVRGWTASNSDLRDILAAGLWN